MITSYEEAYEEIWEEVAYSGFFSEYLPPCFKIDHNFGMFTQALPPSKIDNIEPLSYTMSRFDEKDSRRRIYLPEICSYIKLMSFIKDNNILKELIEFSAEVDVSYSPIINEDGSIQRHEQAYGLDTTEERQIHSSNYIKNIIEKINKAKGARGILNLDISNCFSSCYTHLFPAILLGYEESEKQYKGEQLRASIYIKYEKLDNKIRKMNGNRTNGILVGPLISKIIMEAMLSRIDKELLEQNLVFSRYVDDYEIYIYSDQEVEKVISCFERILDKYHFSINREKIKYVKFPYYIDKNLEKIIKQHLDNGVEDVNIMELFNTFFVLESNGVKGAIRFLLKTLEANQFSSTERIYSSYLLSILNNNKRSLIKVCSILIKNKETINTDPEFSEVILKLLKNEIDSNNDLEVVWLLYLYDKLSLENFNTELIETICKSRNDLAKIVLLTYYNLFLGDFHIDIMTNTANSWILLYELFRLDKIDKDTFKSRLGLDKSLDTYEKYKTKGYSFIKE